MLPRSYAHLNCSIARTLELLGDRWTLLVLHNALVGQTRFEQFQRTLEVAPNVLTDRLGRLVADGLLERRQYEDRPPRFGYHVTAKGRDLWPVLVAMTDWGDRYAAPNGPPGLLHHESCGGAVRQQLWCAGCGAEVEPDQITTSPGPGAAVDAMPAPAP